MCDLQVSVYMLCISTLQISCVHNVWQFADACPSWLTRVDCSHVILTPHSVVSLWLPEIGHSGNTYTIETAQYQKPGLLFFILFFIFFEEPVIKHLPAYHYVNTTVCVKCYLYAYINMKVFTCAYIQVYAYIWVCRHTYYVLSERFFQFNSTV